MVRYLPFYNALIMTDKLHSICQSNTCQSNTCQSNTCQSNTCQSNTGQSNTCQSNTCQSNTCQSNTCQSNTCQSSTHRRFKLSFSRWISSRLRLTRLSSSTGSATSLCASFMACWLLRSACSRLLMLVNACSFSALSAASLQKYTSYAVLSRSVIQRWNDIITMVPLSQQHWLTQLGLSLLRDDSVKWLRQKVFLLSPEQNSTMPIDIPRRQCSKWTDDNTIRLCFTTV